MVAAPDPTNPQVMLTLEARPKVGYDSAFEVEGVAAYIIDQRSQACQGFSFSSGPCMSTYRRQRPAIALAPNAYDHILQVGTTTTINGVTITVTGKVGNTFTVQTSGTFVAPAPES